MKNRERRTMEKLTLEEKINRIVEAFGGPKHIPLHVSVKHDKGCPALKTNCLMDCNCNFDVERWEDA